MTLRKAVAHFLAGAIAAMLLFFIASDALDAQTPAPAASTSTFSIGAGAMGLGGATAPATDVNLTLNPGFKGTLANLELRSDNLLAPSPSLQYYGGGGNFVVPKKLPGVLAPLSFYVDATVGVVRIVPATGVSQSHVGFLAGGGLRWLMRSGVQINVIEVDVLHAPGAPWGTNAPAVQGSLQYVFGKH